MMPSATASNPKDSNSDLELENNIAPNLPIINHFENKSDISAANGPKFQSSSQLKPQVLPVVYIQAPSKIPFVTIGKTNSTNVIVKSIPPIQFPTVSTALSNKPISSLSVPSNQSVLLSHTNSSLKSQQIVIQKSGGVTNAYLTMIKPVTNLGKHGENASANQIHISTNITTTSTYVHSSVGQKYVLASLPKSGPNLASTVTTSSVQSKLAFMPFAVKPSAVEKSINNLKVISPVLNFKIADGKVQSTSNSSPITVMCDSNSVSSYSENSSESKLICTEVIDLDSPTKDEKSLDSDFSSTPEPKIDYPVQQTKEIKISQHGISILKRNSSFARDSFFQNSKITPKSDYISELTIQKDIMVTKPSTGIEEKIVLSESNVTASMSQKSGRRKSNFCFRKDFDDIPIQFFDSRDDLKRTLEDSDISLTKAENAEPFSIQRNDDDDVEINLIKDKLEEPDLNMNNNLDIRKLIKWENDVGILPGSDLRFIINEFDMLEYLTKAEYNKIIEGKNVKLKEKIKDEFQEEMRCTECGCFGLPSDFISPKYCSYDCQGTGKQKTNRDKEIKYRKRKRAIIRKQETEENKTGKDESESSDDNSSNDNSRDKFSYPWNCAKKGFSWSKYLEHMKAKAAPVKLFKDAFPYNRNAFKPGMKLEGIDPLHPSHCCVLTVAEVQGYRMRLHFDGFSTNYDFWVNADSMDIFPMGWCEKYGHVLHPPPGYKEDDFNWLHYLKETKSTASPKHLFANRAGNAICPNGFRVGMKLEAVDKKNNSSLICVATVRDMMDNRILVHFDSWDDIYDYWAEPTSPYIHPVGWCDQLGHRLTPPNDYPRPEEFTWEEYLRETKSVAAPVRAFKQKPACGFKRGMKLECVDQRVPQLIRVATVDEVRGHQIKIHFDGWLDKYSYWVEDDSPDIHPVGWCQKTGHPIEPPLTPEDVYDFLECSIIGCKGQGHVLGPAQSIHSSLTDCPYADENLTRERKLPDRLLSPDRFIEAVVPVSRGPKDKPKARLGRPPKYPRLEPKIEDDYPEEQKLVTKYKQSNLGVDLDVEDRIMAYLKDIQINPVEKESWLRHSKFLGTYTEFKADPRNWSCAQVANFIESLPTGSDYADIFKQHEIDGEALLLLTQKDIMDILKIKLGPAIKLYNSVILLRQNIEKIFIIKK